MIEIRAAKTGGYSNEHSQLSTLIPATSSRIPKFTGPSSPLEFEETDDEAPSTSSVEQM